MRRRRGLELQHLKPQILDRINSHFGYAAVADLRFRQGSAPVKAGSRPPVRDSKPPTPAEIAETTAAVASVPEGKLRQV
jgi:hypothetical protein